jgi:preprotein translocase subunit SecG
MSWIVGILSVFLVVACLLLILLVLIQLPKKEAGMGQAFGGGATDALFGAGSGTALTKMTKYTTVMFFVLTLMLWVLKAQEVKHSRTRLEKTMQELGQSERPLPPATPGATANAPKAGPAPAANALLSTPSTNGLLSVPTNGGTKALTNAAPAAESGKTK